MTKKNLRCKVISFPDFVLPFKTIECLALNIQLSRFKSFILCLVYRPLFYLTTEDIDFFDRLISELHKYKQDFYICGDLNIHFENTNDRQIKRFTNMLNRNNVFIITKEPTRNDARLDCFISNDQEKITDDGVTNPHLSDHLCCFITRKCLIDKLNQKPS